MLSPTITIRNKEYPIKRLTSTAYVRLSALIKPMDGTLLSDMVLDNPKDITDPQRRAQALIDRSKMATTLSDRLGDDITARRLAYAIKSMVPGLAEDGLVIYEHLIRPDDWIEMSFDIADLEIEEILDLLSVTSTLLQKKQKLTHPQPGLPFEKPKTRSARR